MAYRMPIVKAPSNPLAVGASSFLKSFSDAYQNKLNQDAATKGKEAYYRYLSEMQARKERGLNERAKNRKQQGEKDTRVAQAKFLAEEAQKAEKGLQDFVKGRLQLVSPGLPMDPAQIDALSQKLEADYRKAHPHEAMLIDNRGKYMGDVYQQLPLPARAMGTLDEEEDDQPAPQFEIPDMYKNPNALPFEQ